MKIVGLWNSGSPAPKEALQKGLARLEKLGIAAVYPEKSRRHASRPASKTQPFLAGPDHDKVETLLELASSREIRDILALRGGYGGIRLLPHFDKIESLKRFDKIIWGYSDLTVVQHYFFNRSGAPWVHAPMLSSSSFFNPNPSEARWWKSPDLAESQVFKLKPLSNTLALKRSEVDGTLLGGNLACLVSMMGTPWEPRFPSSTLLFLEDIHEPPYKLDRLLHQLGGHRDISQVKSIVLGHFTECPQAHALVKLWSEDLGIPTYRGVPAGHEAPHVPLVLGQRVNLQRLSAQHAALKMPKFRLGS